MKKTLLTAIIASGTVSPLFSQKPPAVGGPTAPGGNNDTVARRESQPQASAHGQDIPIVDPTNKTIDFQGKKYSLLDNNLGGQFEAFLATDTLSSEEATKYRKTLRKILDFVSPTHTGGPKLRAAYDLLSVAAEYPGDGNLCESLANAIYSAQLTKSNIGTKKEFISNLQKEEKALIRKMSVIQEKGDFFRSSGGGGSTSNRSNTGNRNSGNSGNRQRNTTSSFSGNIELQSMQRRLVEITALIKKTETSGVIDLTQSKIQYQAMMVQLFIQRRFEHVVMAARFYNLIFKDGDVKMRLKRGSDTEKFFSEGIGVNPTVAGLDAAANEAIRKVSTLVSAFNNNIASGKVHGASERLVESFAIGEFITTVQTIPAKSKLTVLNYVQDANDLVKTLEAKDLERGEELNNRLRSVASDYNSSEATSYIAAKKTESKSFARDAKIALFQIKKANSTKERYDEEQRFKTAMFKATSAWPSNPDLEDINGTLDQLIQRGAEGEDFLLVARKDFDRYVDTQSWAAIMKKENLSRFLAAFGVSQEEQDVERRNKLDEITTGKTTVIAALREAQTLYDRGFAEAAWETIHIKQQDSAHTNDLELSRAMAEYSSKAAEFSNIITKAQDMESKSDTSAQALTWYLKAQNIHPDSKYASAGIDRIIYNKFKSGSKESESSN